MARMHTRKRGRSGSKNVFSESDHAWVTATPEEVTQTVLSLRREGLSKSVVGMRLRDQYGLPSTKVMLGKKLGTVLNQNKLGDDIPEDLKGLISKYKSISRHIGLNRADTAASRNRNLIMAKIQRLVKYYKRNNYLSAEWSLSKVL
jgi:small subunit ribosomal protein S15